MPQRNASATPKSRKINNTNMTDDPILYLTSIVMPLLDNKAVRVDSKADDRGLLLTLNVAPEDIGS